MIKFIYVMLFVSLAIFTVISSEDRVNKTKTKLKIAYLIPWTLQFSFGTVTESVIMKAWDNVKNRRLF